MKLRLRDDSLRLRLSQTEVGAIANRESVRSVVKFAGARTLAYVLECSINVDAVTATFASSPEGATITVRIPVALAQAWAQSETVGLRGTTSVDRAGGGLSILVEKDFACLSPNDRGEDESDLFPHPEAGSPKARC